MTQEVVKGRWAAFDGLRGLAALLVMAHHAEDYFTTTHLFAHAYISVDLFFMLSGIVIAHAYEP